MLYSCLQYLTEGNKNMKNFNIELNKKGEQFGNINKTLEFIAGKATYKIKILSFQKAKSIFTSTV